jgi:hypothetical protein
MCINTVSEVTYWYNLNAFFVYYYSQQTERRGRVVNIPALYSEVSSSNHVLETG